MISADIFAAFTLESFNIENIKFCRVVLIFAFFCLEFTFLISVIICVSRNCLKFLSWHLKSSKNKLKRAVGSKRDLLRSCIKTLQNVYRKNLF